MNQPRRQGTWMLTWTIFVMLFISRGLCSSGTLQTLDYLLKGYDRRVTPTNHLNTSTKVDVELFIRSISFVNPQSGDYQVDLYLLQSWVDDRLDHEDIKQPLDLNDPNLVRAIWKPEVYFPNAKDSEFHFVTVPNVLVRINSGGNILYMLRLKLLFSCMLDFTNYPLDSQVCTMEIASFSKMTKELNLSWKSGGAVPIHRYNRMPQFEIRKVAPTTCRESLIFGNYSCLMVAFHLRRSIGFHLLESYLPSGLIVVISWVSFWMDPEAVTARAMIGVMTLLAISFKATGIQTGLPQVSYVKAIDIWMGFCTALVFVSLLEFTLVSRMCRRRGRPLEEEEEENGGGEGASALGKEFARFSSRTAGAFKPLAKAGEMGTSLNCGEDSSWHSGMQSAHKIDALSRIAFPVAFAFFNIIYWYYFLGYRSHGRTDYF